MTRRSMLRAALAYVERGWPVVPGATPYGAVRRQLRLCGPNGPVWVGCSCGSAYCVSPAAHPVDPRWQQHLITSTAEVTWWWSQRSGALPNIVLACGIAFEVWAVPRVVGACAVELLPADVALATPVAVTPTGWWHLFTAPRAAGEQVPPLADGMHVRYLSAGTAIAAPPSTRGALGHDLWLRQPQPKRRLPPCGVVGAAVLGAADPTQRAWHRRYRGGPVQRAASCLPDRAGDARLPMQSKRLVGRPCASPAHPFAIEYPHRARREGGDHG